VTVSTILGFFSFAEANVLYEQTATGTSIQSVGSGHNIAGWCIPITSSFDLGQINYVVTPNIKYQAYAAYIFAASDSTCGSVTLIGSESIGIPSTTTISTHDFVNTYALGTLNYLYIQLSDGGTPGGMTNTALGSTGRPVDPAPFPSWDNNAYLVAYDSMGRTIVPDWRAMNPLRNSYVSQYIGTSTSIFSGTTSSSTLEAIANECADQGNLFTRAICRAFSYLFVPNPMVFNEFVTLGSTTASKFPFSWVYGIKEELENLSATSATTSFTVDMSSAGVGSTTIFGNILPNITLFSYDTVTEYMPVGIWTAIQALMAAALWIALGYDIYHTVRRRHAHV